ncbi:MAG: spermidine N1-acetyltransferase [Spirochaetaceae bacterium]|jgi:diamine N-acetyltransferase|nr:spermidine N1-acetyltransferase [Spirochaetaceae bacterium]
MKLTLRPLERKDLSFVHDLDNERRTMAFWFEEPYESLDELTNLYDKHIHDDHERRFVIDVDDQFAGIIELVNINFIHRHTEIQIIIKSDFQGLGLAKIAMSKGMDYAFNILNMYKIYLYVDAENHKAVHIYKGLGFVQEGILRRHFFVEGAYHDSIIMGIFSREIQNRRG